MLCALVVLARPDDTVGYASHLANDASLGMLAAATGQDIDHPEPRAVRRDDRRLRLDRARPVVRAGVRVGRLLPRAPPRARRRRPTPTSGWPIPPARVSAHALQAAQGRQARHQQRRPRPADQPDHQRRRDRRRQGHRRCPTTSRSSVAKDPARARDAGGRRHFPALRAACAHRRRNDRRDRAARLPRRPAAARGDPRADPAAVRPGDAARAGVRRLGPRDVRRLGAATRRRARREARSTRCSSRSCSPPPRRCARSTSAGSARGCCRSRSGGASCSSATS